MLIQKVLLGACLTCAAAHAQSATPLRSLKVSPSTASVQAGGSTTFSVVWQHTAPVTVTWSVVSTAAQYSGSLGSISSAGVYTAPAASPVPNTVIVRAVDSANRRLGGSATVAVVNPVPTIASLSPNFINTGLPYSVDIQGTGFLATSQVTWNGQPAGATFVSATDIRMAGTSTLAAGSKVAITVVNPTPGGGTSNAATLTVNAPVAVTLAPDGRTVRCGATLALTAKVTNTTDTAVIWQVNGQAGGNSTAGTVSTAGIYTAPAILPNPTAVIVTAVSHADPTAEANVTVTIQNPMPVVTSVTPNPVNPGTATLTVSGTGFARGSTVYFAGAALPTTFVSSTQLTATGKVAMPVGRMAAVKVANPNPGAATSAPLAVPVRVANEQMAYADAVRFLEMTTWGPTPQSVADLQTVGRDAWLAAQFAAPASAWPDPDTTTEGVARLQSAFSSIALTGADQLRQRASFALAEILVVSAVKNTAFEQMVGYQRLLGNDAFGSYRDLLTAIALDPSMGYFLDMVNNDQANPAKGTVANENYARELMQLFTVGLVQLDPQGVPIASGGATLPEYDQTTVTPMAKVMTGWTYGETPGFASLWTNMPYYFGPMVAFEDHHDTTQKNINLPIPCVIPGGGTAESDLTAALDCLYRQSNVAPFVSYRLIQRFVMSDPPPAYVGRVAAVFQSSGGNLQSVITAVLTDPEAHTEGTGKLAEPILYATGLLRALNATVATADALAGQDTAMGQTPLSPGSVFSYFSPFYRVPGIAPPVVAPEFQAMEAATALARANFAYRAATNGISGNIVVDLTNLLDLASNPPDLVEALNQALFRGEMDSGVRGLLVTAASASTSTAARVRSALYAAAAAPQYEVQR
jgi:uncharacterized protein (DUF1800 family)/cold shock CspA family protein